MRCKKGPDTKLRRKLTPTEIFVAGRKRVEGFFDVVSFVRQFREMQVYLQSALTHRQRPLIKRQRRLMLNEVADDHGSELEQDRKQNDIREQILSMNRIEQAQGIKCMGQILRRYTDAGAELSRLDVALLRGVFDDDPSAPAADIDSLSEIQDVSQADLRLQSQITDNSPKKQEDRTRQSIDARAGGLNPVGRMLGLEQRLEDVLEADKRSMGKIPTERNCLDDSYIFPSIDDESYPKTPSHSQKFKAVQSSISPNAGETVRQDEN